MAVSFSVPKSPSKSIFQMNTFQGCDFTNSPANVDNTKSPNCVNMIRDVPGKIRKSMGYKTQIQYDGQVNGSFYLRSSDEQLIHAGDGVYHNNVLLYRGANNHRSKSWQFDTKLFIQDGKEWLIHECVKADTDEGQTVGYNSKEVIGITYTESTKSKKDDKVYFYFPYPVVKITVNGTETTVDKVNSYEWTCPSNGDYTFQFDAFYEVEHITGEGTYPNEYSFKLELGLGSTVTFPDYDYSVLKVSYHDEYDRVIEQDITKNWENNYGDNEFTFYYKCKTTTSVKSGDTFTFREGYSYRIIPPENYKLIESSYVVSTPDYSQEFPTYYTDSNPDTFVFNSEILYPAPETYDCEINVVMLKNPRKFREITDPDLACDNGYVFTTAEMSHISVGDKIYYSPQYEVNMYGYYVDADDNRKYTYLLESGDDENGNYFIAGDTTECFAFDGMYAEAPGPIEEFSYSINTPFSTQFSLEYDYSFGVETDYVDYKELKGKLEYTVNCPMVNGFIDNTSGKFIDEGYYRYVKKVRDVAHIPTVTISKEPQGGGTSYYPLNLLQPGFIELFTGKANVTAYQLSFSGLDSTPVIVKVLNSSGAWVTKKEGTDFTVNRAKGIVNFTTAPGVSPLTGEDNVSIQAYRTVSGYADRINKTTISILFGVNGNGDRIFASGNPDYINYDWYSEKDDPTYWPDTAYSVLGSSSSAIVGYSIISNYIAAHKDDMERDTNIILREGNLVENEPMFPIVASLQGAGAVAPWSFAYLETEPVFLTKRGIYAVTAQDITGEKYSQNRSYYLDGKLLDEKDLDKAYACVFNDFYILALNDSLYILDGLQPIQTDKSMPYATRQYAGFYRTNVPANCMWAFNDELFFGTKDGKVCKFYTDKDDLYSYNDDGEAIECVWESPDLDGKYFFKNKTFRYIAIRLDSAIATSINIFTMKRGIWNLAKTDASKGRYFTFPYLNFNKFSFSTDTTQKIVHTKLRVKKVDKARFRFTNTEVNEPFGIFDVALEFIENGNYKG